VRHILTLNAGSSSIKFALFDLETELAEGVRGEVEGLGSTPHLRAEKSGKRFVDAALDGAKVTDHNSALTVALDLLENEIGKMAAAAVGHRVVHGGVAFTESIVLDEPRIADLQKLSPLAPLHQPHSLSGVRAAQRAFPDAHAGCLLRHRLPPLPSLGQRYLRAAARVL
jgi:acetate kinase